MSGPLPDGACDAHCHVFGPASVFPYDAARSYTPEGAPKGMLVELHRKLGLDWAVVVQPNCYGFDHRAALDAIAASGGRWRGVALIGENATSQEVEALHTGGMRGARFNFTPHLGGPPSERYFRSVVDLIAPLGWHVVLHLTPEDLPLAERYVGWLKIPFVIDHMARIDARRGPNQPGFQRLVDLLGDPRAWVKLSGADRASALGCPFTDVVPFMAELLRQAPGRCLWGTDWPHPNIRGTLPEEADLLVLLRDAMNNDKSLFKAVLADNPTQLYR